MNLVTLLDMARTGVGDRVAIGSRSGGGLTFAELAGLAGAAGDEIRASGARHVVFIGVNGPAWPICLFGSSAAGVPVVPLNYRLSADQIAALISRIDDAFIIADERYLSVLPDGDAVALVESGSWIERLKRRPPHDLTDAPDPKAPAVILFTSGTTSEPKGVVLRHDNLSSYVLNTVEFGSASPDEAALVSVPPYHVAGVGTVLTNTFAGRRLVYLQDFDARSWLDTVNDERITQAMVVPTMLARVVSESDEDVDVPSLRSIAYGGAPMPRTVLARALRLLPEVEFVNSYGLTETSSTIAVLGPDDHRRALASSDPVAAERLGSAGRPVPGIELSVRDESGREVPAGVPGELWVRGPQVSAEYLGLGTALDSEGWFATRDRVYIDDEGYLFVLGRSDDTIIRGGENIAPEEIELVLRTHPSIADAAVVGVADEEWGQRIVAAVVRGHVGDALSADEVRSWTRDKLRGSRTPDDVVFVTELPYSPLGKLVRRDLEVLVAKQPKIEERA